MDDLRPFWALEPKTMRRTAARLQETDGVSGVHIRGKKVTKLTKPGWRAETLAGFISRFVEYLPDMDIAVNSMDQPRLVVPYEDMQVLLQEEKRSRKLPPNMKDQYTEGMGELLDLNQETHDWGDDDATDPHWFFYAGGRQYMDIAKLVCPPDSPARNPEMSPADVDKLYRTQMGDFVSDFSLSTDLCIVGPKIQSQHGFLSSPASISASKRLLPVFSECKVSANSDILFPANMYMLQDERYSYDPTYDLEWESKADTLMWRGVTSGGIQTPETWRNLHRQRLVLMTNETEIDTQDFPILSQAAGEQYQPSTQFNASEFAQKHFDVGFTATMACIPNCDFYDGNVTLKSQVELPKQFENKFLIDVDGHSFSGRWRAFEYSKSLGIKATIFREWHDSRLFAWRHFVPLDNLYDEFYSLMTYFTGHGSTPPTHQEQEAYMPAHDFEGKMIAAQGRTWAQHVLRDEDLEIYTLRLFLEYARLLDDHRDYIGYDGDGSELDEFDRKHPMPDNLALFSWKEMGVNSDDHLRSDFEWLRATGYKWCKKGYLAWRILAGHVYVY